jgi:hypothetical protein
MLFGETASHFLNRLGLMPIRPHPRIASTTNLPAESKIAAEIVA